MNLQTGYKEAKILVEEPENTAMLQVEKQDDDASGQQAQNSDVEMEAARNRLEDALKNIPSDKFDPYSAEQLKEISQKYRSYKELKEDLKELKLEMKSEAEILKELIASYTKLPPIPDERSSADMQTILEDLEYLAHSIDNSLLFISMGGLEQIIIPNLNQTNVKILLTTLKTLGALLQNNAEAKKYAVEKTNVANYLISSLSKPIDGNQLSAALFAYGSLMRNNRLVSPDMLKKGLTVLNEIIALEKTEISLSVKTKALVLVDDLMRSEEVTKDQDFVKFIESSKVCKQLDDFFHRHRNGFVTDMDCTEKTINAFVGLRDKCFLPWHESGSFRHSLLVLSNNFKSRLDTPDVDLKFMFNEIVSRLDELIHFLYRDLKISQDDLSLKYDKSHLDDEL
jgi:nucleotide exchange factor SIL1